MEGGSGGVGSGQGVCEKRIEGIVKMQINIRKGGGGSGFDGMRGLEGSGLVKVKGVGW